MNARVTYHPALWVANVVSPIYTKLEVRHAHICIEYKKICKHNAYRRKSRLKKSFLTCSA